MNIKIVKWLAAATLLLAGLVAPNSGFQWVVEIVVCIAALFVFWQALMDKRWIWAAVFLAVSITYNPVAPFHFSKSVFLWLDLLSLMTFLVSLEALKQRAKLTLASVTNQRTRSASL